MKLSQHFSLYEFTRSQTATRYCIDMTPSPEIISNLQILCNDILEPLRKDLDTIIIISSGYRCLALNVKIGGSKRSSHITGDASDIIVVGMKPIAVCKIIRDLGLDYDQNIHEFGEWTHWGIGERLRNQDLTAYRKDGKVLYSFGIHPLKDLI